jgi:hypothetical protein
MKPIAYFVKDSNGWWAETDKESGIPLYTAPRELSDEEIVRISETCDLNHVLGLIDFGRAILKKASE